MATYYVRTDGNDGNAGTGSTSGQAWKTIQKALGSTGIGSGDTVYIAPGVYREAVTIGGTYSTTTYITGDPTSSQFSGVAAGEVRITGFSNDTSNTMLGTTITATSKNNLYWSNLFFQNLTRCISATTCTGWTFDKCMMQSVKTTGGGSVGFWLLVASCWLLFYRTLRTCSLIFSRSSFICTTWRCMPTWWALLPRVLISRPSSWAKKPSLRPSPAERAS